MIVNNFKMHFLKISEHFSGQRIDNFLRIYLKSVPKSMIYRIIRTGKIQINRKKVNFYYKLQIGDLLRIPEVKKIKVHQIFTCSEKNITLLKKSIIYEDNYILALNKPSGIAVHDGSGLQFNIIDGLRNILKFRTQFLELAHRLDRDTSGILLLAKNRTTLTYLQKQWNLQIIEKEYLALVCGLWNTHITYISIPILKKFLKINFMDVTTTKFAKTHFEIKEFFNNLATLLIIKPITGRTHQIRIHTQYANHPIIGDRIYGNNQINMQFKNLGLNRLFLHASKLCFIHPNTQNKICLRAPLDQSFNKCLSHLRNF